MDKIRVIGGNPLKGKIAVSGAKNAVLPLMSAALLSEDLLHLTNVPKLADIHTLSALLEQHGCSVERAEGEIKIQAKRIESVKAPYELVRKMRASILVLGPLLTRCGEAEVSLPGGCAIGTRPVDLHLEGLKDLGAQIKLEEGYVHAKAPKGLQGGRVVFPKISVGATENLLMAAVLAKGESELVNVAREPEIIDLAECLIKMGAKIEGQGTDTIRVQGVSTLQAAKHSVLADRIETGTYLMTVGMTGGSLILENASLESLGEPVALLRKAGLKIEEEKGQIHVSSEGKIQGIDMITEPYPGFPTDLQAQFMALMSLAEGASMITETIFENRFMHVPELVRMGANITVHAGASALIRGKKKLTGAPVMATDLRASVAMIMAGLAADGVTEMSRIYHLDRGYDNLEQKLAACGAQIERISEPAEA